MRRLICRLLAHRWGDWQTWKVSTGVLVLGWRPEAYNGTAEFRWCRRCGASESCGWPLTFPDGTYRAVIA